MKYLTAFLFLLLGCTHTSNFIAENQKLKAGNYYANFTHNGTEYAYKTEAKDIATLVSKGAVTDVATVANFFQGDSLHLSLVIAGRFKPGTGAGEIRAGLRGEVPTMLDEDYPVGTVFFAPFFNHSDNGGYLAKDGEQYSYVNITKRTDFYPDGGKDCFDILFEFDVFANTGFTPCGLGTDYPSCFNLFTQGEAQIQICL